MKEVFISYKSDEIGEALWVKERLEQNGLSCWMAPGDIPGGSSYAVEIPQAIRNAKVFVLVLSENTQNSQWVPKEIDMAINFKRKIMPFMLEDFALKDDFNFYLSNIQRYPAFENKEEAAAQMIAEIKRLIDAEKPAPAPAEPPVTDEISNEEDDEGDTPAMEEAPTLIQSEAPQQEKAPAPQIQQFPVSVNDPIPDAVNTPSMPNFIAPPPADNVIASTVAEENAKPTTITTKKKKLPIIIGAVAALLLIVVVVAMLNAPVTICGEKYKKNTSSLSLENQKVTMADYNKIAKLKKLNYLSMVDCDVDSIALSRLFMDLHYENLTLDNCGVNDTILAVANTNNSPLKNIDLSNNEMTNVDFLQPIIGNLYTITLNNTKIIDYSFISDATGAYKISLSGNNLEDISFLSGMEGVTELNLSHNKLTSIQPLQTLKKLNSVNVSANQLTSLTGLENSLDLRSIYAQNNHLTSLDGIANSTLLSTVFLDGNALADIDILAKSAESLVTVSVAGNLLTSTSSLKDCTNVKYLNINDNQIDSLSGLSKMGDLCVLSAENNQIDSIVYLESCRDLYDINLANNKIYSIDYLKNFYGENTIRLDFSNNQITSIKALSPYVEYSYLYFQGNSISDIETLSTLSFYDAYVEYYDRANYAKFTESGHKNGAVHLLNTPLDQQKTIEAQFGSFTIKFETEDEIEGTDYLANVFKTEDMTEQEKTAE